MGIANNGADVKPNQGVGATNTSTTTNTAENTVGTATPQQNGLAVLGKHVGVSATQTIVEYATFAILHLIGVPSQVSNGIAVVCSATYNFVMNRNVTFKSSSNFTRSVALFVLLWGWFAVAFAIMVVIAFAIIGMQRAMSSTTRQNTHGNHHDNILSQRGYHRTD